MQAGTPALRGDGLINFCGLDQWGAFQNLSSLECAIIVRPVRESRRHIVDIRVSVFEFQQPLELVRRGVNAEAPERLVQTGYRLHWVLSSKSQKLFSKLELQH